MSTPIYSGGAAFPQPNHLIDTDRGREEARGWMQDSGMSLRAYIATKAMQSIIGLTTSGDAATHTPDALQAATARAACCYADALIAELGKGDK